MHARIQEILTALADTAEPESPPKMEGRNMIVFVKSKK
jgi:translation initiation factor IF-3